MMLHGGRFLSLLCLLAGLTVVMAAFNINQQLGHAYQSGLRGLGGRLTTAELLNASAPQRLQGSLSSILVGGTGSSFRYRFPTSRTRGRGASRTSGRGRDRVLIPGIPRTPASPVMLEPSVPGPSSQGTGVVCQTPTLVCVEGRYRSADGSCNNLHGHPTWGMAGRTQERLLPPAYQDGSNAPRTHGVRGQPLPSPREISQVLHSADSVHTESPTLSHMFTMWGQFLDHDITHTPMARDMDGSALDCCNQPRFFPERDLYWISESERRRQNNNHNPNCFPISLSPLTDRHYKKECMNFVRSKSFAPSASCKSATREQGNTQTSYIDASQVYGPSLGDQGVLRTFTAGQLVSAQNDLLPANKTTTCTINLHEGEYCFGSGDPRVNEHPMLSSIHVVFHRYHNMLASRLALLNLHWNDETLFQETRKIIGAIMQHITYAEYLPLVLGDREMARYNLTLHGLDPYVYDPYVNPNILNSFSTAAFRFGHSMVNGLNSYGFTKVNLRDMFFHPHFVQHGKGSGLTMLMHGLLVDRSQKCDRFMTPDLTDHMFQSKDGRSLDLASLNIQRGRDHGLPAYDVFRQACGLPSLQDLLTTMPEKLVDMPFLSVYRDLEDVDLFTGGLSEPPVEGGAVGGTFACIIGRQFQAIKAGDRFWYQNSRHPGAFTADQIRAIEKMGLTEVLCDTHSVTAVQANPFVKASRGNPVKECASIPPMDLSAWKEGPSHPLPL